MNEHVNEGGAFKGHRTPNGRKLNNLSNKIKVVVWDHNPKNINILKLMLIYLVVYTRYHIAAQVERGFEPLVGV